MEHTKHVHFGDAVRFMELEEDGMPVGATSEVVKAGSRIRGRQRVVTRVH